MHTLLKTAMALSVVVMAGCQTAPHTCKLPGKTPGACKGIEDTYQAVEAGGGSGLSVFEEEEPAKKSVDLKTISVTDRAPEMHPLNRKPVWTPAKVFRVWIAPWKDGEGQMAVMHSGESLYFSTEGQWNYGTLTTPGVAAGLLQPVAPRSEEYEENIKKRNRVAPGIDLGEVLMPSRKEEE